MSDVPDEIFREILSWLPVAPLLRFRCVSKSWKNLIDSQEFIKHHLTHSRKANSNIDIVLRSSNQLYSADFNLLNETFMATFKQLSHPLNTSYTKIWGSCDGLLVLRNNQNKITNLWNPSVNRFHVIPCTSIESARCIRVTYYGFGYDVLTDDYKLITITQFYGQFVKVNSEVKVYSLNSDSWRRIPDFPYRLGRMTKGVFANGALHWIVAGKVKSCYSVIAFDLGTEEYRLVPLPNFAGDVNPCMDMVLLGGCLSLSYFDNAVCVVWVMKEYGVQESWSILFNYDFCDRGFMLWPLAYSKCGKKVLLLVDDDVLWFDLDKKSIDVPMIEMPSGSVYNMFTCLESLVLLNNGTCDYDTVTNKIQERKDSRYP